MRELTTPLPVACDRRASRRSPVGGQRNLPSGGQAGTRSRPALTVRSRGSGVSWSALYHPFGRGAAKPFSGRRYGSEQPQQRVDVLLGGDSFVDGKEAQQPDRSPTGGGRVDLVMAI
jgi:hypothetical protein